MISSSAFFPKVAVSRGDGLPVKFGIVLGGVAWLALMAQVAIPLPWTPVPLTGQTFAVAGLALVGGRNLGAASMALYLLLAALGAPILAQATSLAILGPTSGYLAGMLLASLAVGELADRGYAKTFGGALACSYVGSFFIFAFGLFMLSHFVAREHLLMAGLWPFLPGDLLKNTLAAAGASRLNQK